MTLCIDSMDNDIALHYKELARSHRVKADEWQGRLGGPSVVPPPPSHPWCVGLLNSLLP